VHRKEEYIISVVYLIALNTLEPGLKKKVLLRLADGLNVAAISDGKRERSEWMTRSHIMLPIGLNPMQPQGVQERRKTLHDTKNKDRQGEPNTEHEKDSDRAKDAGRPVGKHTFQSHTPQHLTELGVSEGESPKTEIGGSVRDTAETELDGMNDLVDGNLAKFEALMFSVLFTVPSGNSTTLFFLGHISTVTPMAIIRSDSSVASTLLLLVFLPQQVWLHAQHPRHADGCQQQQEHLEWALTPEHFILWLEGARREEHKDEHVEQARGRHSGSGPVCDPFEDDATDEITEDGLEEEDLGDKFGPDVNALLEVDMVRNLEANRKRHMDDAQDNRHLHLVRICEHKPVLGAVPAWVQPDRINIAIVLGLYLTRLEVPSRVPDVHGLAEDIVVHKPSEHGEETHENDNVTAVEECANDFAQISPEQLLLVKDHCGRSQKSDEPVAKITEHNGEQERERNHGE